MSIWKPFNFALASKNTSLIPVRHLHACNELFALCNYSNVAFADNNQIKCTIIHPTISSALQKHHGTELEIKHLYLE